MTWQRPTRTARAGGSRNTAGFVRILFVRHRIEVSA
jgi:hypothetical protein